MSTGVPTSASDRRMPGEGELGAGREDPDPAGDPIVDEHRLAEAEVGGHRLATLFGDRRPVEEDAEPVAGRPVVGHEDPEHVQLGRHGRDGRSEARSRATRSIASWLIASSSSPRSIMATTSANGTRRRWSSSVASGAAWPSVRSVAR